MRLVGFDDERAQVGADRVGVHGEIAVLGLLVQEGQSVELERGAEPDELDRGLVYRMPELVDETFPRRRVRAVGGDDQVVLTAGVERVDIHGGRKMKARAQFGRAVLQCSEQDPSVHGGHSVAAGGCGHTLAAHLDGVPVPAVLGQSVPQYGIDPVDVVERRVGEHDPEPEDVGFVVAFEDVDRRARHGLRQRDGGEQSARSTADAGDAQRCCARRRILIWDGHQCRPLM